MVHITYKDTEYQIKCHLLFISNCLTFIFPKEIIDSLLTCCMTAIIFLLSIILKFSSYIKLWMISISWEYSFQQYLLRNNSMVGLYHIFFCSVSKGIENIKKIKSLAHLFTTCNTKHMVFTHIHIAHKLKYTMKWGVVSYQPKPNYNSIYLSLLL